MLSCNLLGIMTSNTIGDTLCLNSETSLPNSQLHKLHLIVRDFIRDLPIIQSWSKVLYLKLRYLWVNGNENWWTQRVISDTSAPTVLWGTHTEDQSGAMEAMRSVHNLKKYWHIRNANEYQLASSNW